MCVYFRCSFAFRQHANRLLGPLKNELGQNAASLNPPSRTLTPPSCCAIVVVVEPLMCHFPFLQASDWPTGPCGPWSGMFLTSPDSPHTWLHVDEIILKCYWCVQDAFFLHIINQMMKKTSLQTHPRTCGQGRWVQDVVFPLHDANIPLCMHYHGYHARSKTSSNKEGEESQIFRPGKERKPDKQTKKVSFL